MCKYPVAVACIIKNNFDGFFLEKLLSNDYQLVREVQICWYCFAGMLQLWRRLAVGGGPFQMPDLLATYTSINLQATLFPFTNASSIGIHAGEPIVIVIVGIVGGKVAGGSVVHVIVGDHSRELVIFVFVGGLVPLLAMGLEVVDTGNRATVGGIDAG
jgi:hypothetical protein